jgi:hypothetical protein
VRLLLNAGFGALIGAADLALIRDLGFTGCRQDIPAEADRHTIVTLIREQHAADFDSLFICRSIYTVSMAATYLRETGLPGAIEWGNEEDSKQTPREYHRSLIEPWAHCAGVPMFTGGITTTDRKRLDWLKAVYALGVPEGVHTAIHTYRQETAPWQAKPGFKSRAEEYAEVRRIIGPRRRLIVSEIGWHTAPYKTGGFLGWGRKTAKLSDADVARYAVEECRIAAANGVESLTWFQLNDGPDPAQYEHRFGIRDSEGRLKPVAEALRLFAEGRYLL